MKILVLEDDAKTADFITLALRREGYEIIAVRDGEAALACLADGTFETAILDIMVPRLNGFEVIRRLRETGSRTPLLVLSAKDGVDAKIQGLQLGADDYMTKPFSVQELVARVQALIRRASPVAESTVLRVHDLEIDVIAHRVKRGGETIDLPPLEYQLLECLVRNRGRIVTKTTILERVWDYGFDPHTNVVEARICSLRDRLDKGREKKLIRTVRGFGYVIDD